MIGGRDVIIPTTRGINALEVALRAVCRLWPDALLEDADTGETFQHDRDIGLAGRHEILAFRDSEAAALWEEIGADPSLDGTLIHFLLSESELTVAIDASPSPEILNFVRNLRQNLTPLPGDALAS